MAEVINELLGVPGIKIYQDYEMFNFSLDSILLANFVSIKKNDKMIVDLGTGNAPIPLYMSLNTDADIYGFEIQKKSYDLALKSVKINNKEGQIHIINDDIKNASKLLGAYKADVVVTNPPFSNILRANLILIKTMKKQLLVMRF